MSQIVNPGNGYTAVIQYMSTESPREKLSNDY